tara:strand:- start:5413 stop:5901 length:489 start_codon:yes stop_codon:yes gene_type:complete
MEELRFIFFFSIFAGLLIGCQTGGYLKLADTAPEWVKKTPQKEGQLCAVGASEPTFYKDDAKEYAAENARKELARSLNLEIKNIIVDIATEKGSSMDEGTFMEVSSWATSVVLRESRIIEYWYNEEGVVSHGRKGITYALACMPTDSTIKEISNKLNKAKLE